VAKAYTGRTTRQPTDSATWDLWRCKNCDHGFVNPQPDWKDLDKYYSASYDPYSPDHGLHSDLSTMVANARAKGEYRHVRIRPGLRVLDVGCGGGSFLRVIKELGAMVFGVEPSQDATEVARKQGLDVFHGTLEGFFGNGHAGDRFDLITFSQVAEHLPDPVSTLSTATRFLAPGGTVWVSVPNGACDAARQLGWRWHSTDLPIHLHHFSLKSIKIAAERAGLAPERVYTFSLPSSVRGSILTELRSRWMIPARVATAMLSDARVERRATEQDAKAAGEAIIAELHLPVPAPA